MSRKKLTYFKTARLRSGLTQKDVAILMGVKHHDKISRLEGQRTNPTLTTVLFYSAIFGVSVRVLLPHRVGEIEEVLIHRAGVLLGQFEKSKPTATVNRRIATLGYLTREGRYARYNEK